MSNEGNQLAVYDEITPKRRSILTISNEQLSRLKTLAEMMASSVFNYSKNGKSAKLKSGDIFIKMLKGIEIGLEPIASLDLIDVIEGIPTLKPQGMLALAWGSGQMEALNIIDDGTKCSVTIKRQGTPAHTETFSAQDAEAMELAGKYNWKQQPAVMRKWRAVSAACRIVFPDIIQGMYIPEEIAPELPYDDNGEIETIEQSQASPEETTKYMDISNHPLRVPNVDTPPEITEPEPQTQTLDCLFYRYFVPEEGKPYLQFSNDVEPGIGVTIIRGYGRSIRIRDMLNKIDKSLYIDMALADYKGATKTSEWEDMDRHLRISYTEQNGYNTLTAIELVDLEF